MAPDELAQAEVADKRHQERSSSRRGYAKHECVLQREPGLAELEENEAPVLERQIAGERGRPVAHESRAQEHSVRKGDGAAEHKDKKRERGDLPATQADRFAGAAALPSDDRVTPPAHDGGLRAQQHDRDDEQGQRRGRGQSQLRRKLKQAPDLRGHRIDARR